MYFKLEPEVAGGWGDETIADTSTHPPVVTHLEYSFDGWDGDDLVTSFPCFIVTEKLAYDIENSNLSGYELRPVKISKSETFLQLYPDLKLPSFKWIHITGKAGESDFSISNDNRLVVSGNCLELLERHQLKNCEVEDV